MLTWTRFILFCLILTLKMTVLAEGQPHPKASPCQNSDKLPIVEKVYKTHRGDTLEMVALHLFGHRSWGHKVKSENSSLEKYDDKEKLPPNILIKYHGPKIDKTYRVRRDDTLSRIAEWKYGIGDQWHKVAARNAHIINNPNLIYPGECLAFEDSGTIKNADTNKIVVSAKATKVESSPIEKGKSESDAAQESQRDPSESMSTDNMVFDGIFQNIWVLLGGVLLLLAMGFSLVRAKSSDDGRPLLHTSELGSPKEASRLLFDRSLLVTHENINTNMPPTYHSLLKTWRKYLLLLQKKWRAAIDVRTGGQENPTEIEQPKPVTAKLQPIAEVQTTQLDLDELARLRFKEKWPISKLIEHFNSDRNTICSELQKLEGFKARPHDP